jgi:hypothetical protein
VRHGAPGNLLVDVATSVAKISNRRRPAWEACPFGACAAYRWCVRGSEPGNAFTEVMSASAVNGFPRNAPA